MSGTPKSIQLCVGLGNVRNGPLRMRAMSDEVHGRILHSRKMCQRPHRLPGLHSSFVLVGY